MSSSLTDAVSVDTDDLARFVEQGHRHVAELERLLDDLVRLHHGVRSDVGSVSPVGYGAFAALREAIGDARAGNGFVQRIVESFAGGVGDTAVAYTPMSDRSGPVTNAERDRVLAGMLAGLHPDQMGLHWSYVPAAYRRFMALGRHVETAERERDHADGIRWWPFDDDRDGLAAIDERLAIMHRERAELAEQLGIGLALDREPTAGTGLAPVRAVDELQGEMYLVDRLTMIAAIAEHTGGYAWEGAHYADHYIGFHDQKLTDGILGFKEDEFGDTSGNEVEFRHIGQRLEAHPDAGLMFFNQIGVERTADLPTFLAGNHLSVDEFNNYSLALAAASRAVADDGAPALKFGGADLVTQERRSTRNDVIWYNPALLFAAGEYDSTFLADATVAMLELSHADDDRGRFSHMGSSIHLPGMRHSQWFNGGEDPRNVVLDRAADDPDAATAVVATLGGPRGREWKGGPRSGSLDPLLKPRHPFPETVGPDGGQYWMDNLYASTIGGAVGSGRVIAPGSSRFSSIAYPDLKSDAAVTTFLGHVGEDEATARLLLLYTADSINAEGPMLQGPATAAGLDLILARYAAFMYQPDLLDAVGIEHSTLNDGAPIPIEAKHWQAVHGDGLRFGRGQALAVATDRLLYAAVNGAIDDQGRLNKEPLRAFGQMAGASEYQATEALFDYAAQLDESATERNRRINMAVSGGLGAAGMFGGPLVGLATGAADVGWTWRFEGYPADHEVTARRETWDHERSETLEAGLKNAAIRRYLDATVGPCVEAELFLGERGWISVEVVPADNGDPAVFPYLWRDPADRQWYRFPAATEQDFDRMLPAGGPGWAGQLRAVTDEVAQVVEQAAGAGEIRSMYRWPVTEGVDDVEQERWHEAHWTSQWLATPGPGN